MRVEHNGKYCGACTENSIFPSLPKCKEMENNMSGECEKCGEDALDCWCDIYCHKCGGCGESGCCKGCEICNYQSPLPIRSYGMENNIHSECDKCKSELELCRANYPWNPEFWICPNCDSTYVK